MKSTAAKYEAIAQRMGITVEQVKEVLASADGGTWTTTTLTIITHADGNRHWSNQNCDTCRR